MKKHKFKILGVAILLVVAILSIRSKNTTLIKQDNKNFQEGSEESSCNENDLYDKYSPIIEKKSDNKYVIKITGEDSSVKNAEFQIESIEKGTYTGSNLSAIIKKGQDLELDIIPLEESNGGKTVEVKIKLTKASDGCEGFYTTLSSSTQGQAITSIVGAQTEKNTNIGEGKACTNFINGIYNKSQFSSIKQADFENYNFSKVNQEGQAFYREFLDYCWTDQVYVGANYEEKEISEMISDAISSWKVYSTTIDTTTLPFNTTFEEIKQKAKNAGNYQENATELKLNYKLKCNYKVDKNSTDYYQNKDYYYASQTVDAIKATYTYNYAPGDTQTESKDVCKRVCEEAVKVEYGPPVATRAGFCFEYKVKVTSYVKCNSEITTNSKPKTPTTCTPAPGCNNGAPGYYRQAGPNEEFESCIKECDGGKYTAKCSKKCYNKVYKKSSNKLALNYEDGYSITNLSLKSIEKTSCPDKDGCYYWDGDSIHWAKKNQDFGRWYIASGYCARLGGSCTNGDSAAASYYADSDGVRRANDNGSVCGDYCWWEGCSKGQYLNPQQAIEDTKNNNKAYNVAVTQCKAAASCTETTATFTISAKYDTKDANGKITVNKIDFPYSTKEDSLTSLGATSNIKNTSTNEDSTILDYAGCYDNSNQKRWYMTEWSFPGTWMNYKNGEVSYENKTGTTGWKSYPDKFCLPLNSLSVNSKWWEWSELGKDCYSEAEIKSELNQEYNNNSSSNGYNIKAIAKNFGYFGWNFDISCFYATRNSECNLKENGCCDTPDTDRCTGDNCDDDRIVVSPSEGYTVRSVDTSNLFPNSTETAIAGSTTKKREIGWNWTSAATIPSYKNSQYVVNDPTALIEDIQNNSENTYTDANLDYEFNLTPETLNEIRKYNKTNSYTTWNGTMKDKNGITTYSSNLFRGNNAILDSENVKKVGEIGVNNE